MQSDATPTPPASGHGGDGDATDRAPGAPAPGATEPAAAEPASGAPAPQAATSSRRRLTFVHALIGLTTLLAAIAIFSVWANRLLFNPDNWANTSTQLLQNANVRATTANYVVDQLYANVDVTGLIRSGLPKQLQGLAGPAAGAVRNAAVQGVELALTRPRVQDLWARANRAADKTFIAVVNGGKGAVGVNQGVVTLNLASVVNDVAARLGLPADLGAKLPANIANLTVFRSQQIKLVQNAGDAIRGLAVWLTVIVFVLYALAIVLAPGHRRRTLMYVGFSLALAGVLAIVGRSLLRAQIPGSLTQDASLRTTISDVVTIATGMIGEIAGACILVGAVLVLAAWSAGPARAARAWREAISPFLREHPAASYGATLAIMGLVFIWNPIPATGRPVGIVVFTLLALLGTFVLIRQTAVEFPDARAGAAREKLRAQVESVRRPRPRAHHDQADVASVPEQLRQLAELQERGAITADEYQAAKERLLHA